MWLAAGAVCFCVAVCAAQSGPASCNSPNVRTVIFRSNDLEKECWTREEISLLFTRRISQELLPKKKPRDVSTLVDYMKQCLEAIKCMAQSKRSHAILIAAVADTLGGYLQAFGLPIAHEAYYEGLMTYGQVKQLHDLQDGFRRLLRTNGGGWTRPIKVRKSGYVPCLRPSRPAGGDDACKYLLTKEDIEGAKVEKKKKCPRQKVELLLPFVDNVNQPTAIAMPFKDRNLFSLCSKSGSTALVRYYTRSIQCLVQTYGTAALPETGPSPISEANDFLNSFHDWLKAYVVPRLHDDVWYPGFGSVWRIIESVNRKGKTADDEAFKKNVCTMQLDSPNVVEEECEDVTGRRFYIVMIIAAVIAFWLIIFVLYLLYKWLAKKDDDGAASTDGDSSPEPSDTEGSEKSKGGSRGSKSQRSKSTLSQEA